MLEDHANDLITLVERVAEAIENQSSRRVEVAQEIALTRAMVHELVDAVTGLRSQLAIVTQYDSSKDIHYLAVGTAVLDL